MIKKMMDRDNLKWTIEFYEENTLECDEVLKTPDNFERIPILTMDNFQLYKDGDLVRYRGMVQDILNPEYYYAHYYVRNTSSGEKSLKSGIFRDIATCKEDEELIFNGLAPEERSVYFLIPIPGTSSWVWNHLQKSLKVQNFGNKSSNKRSVEESDDEDMVTGDDEIPDQETKTKKIPVCSGEVQILQNGFQSVDKYFPLPEKNGLPCLAKIYENDDGDENNESRIILNDRIEVIGFLSLNPALENTLDDSDAEDKALNPPPSLVPRIHALRYRKLIHNSPLLDQTINASEILTSADKIRSDLHLALTQALYGDNLAADYMICYLLSRVYSRSGDQALGKLTLNLFNIKMDNHGRRLYDILEILVTNSQYMPLTIEFLNEKSLIPKKDYDTNRLWSGRLQLADGTYLILDETLMNEGKLESIGCLNVAALQNLIRDQEIRYDFSYYDVKYLTNFSVLVLSEGKSMLQTDLQFKLQTDPSITETVEETFEAVSNFLSGEVCDRVRKYLTCMRLQEFEMSEELTLKIGEDYVNMRQQRTGINSFELHNLLVLSRYLAISHGRTSLALEDWSQALEMETERKARLH